MAGDASPRVPTVVGVGNVLLGDDGLGVRAAELVRRRAPAGARVVAGGLAALHLLGEVERASHLLVLDAVDVGGRPGRLIRIDGSQVPRSGSPVLSPHHLNLADLLDLARLRGDEPDEVVVLGVQPRRIEPGLDLSPEVEAALPELVEEAVALLERWVARPAAADSAAAAAAG